jgi:outer membrane protein OmpA-like peptidoglycan-associated protein/tetratricopeptide (TPR) repeat protein
MKQIFLCCFSVFLLSLQLNAQKNKGVYKQNYTEGNYLFLEKNYTQALKSFLAAYAVDSTNGNINYKLGVCYLNISAEKQKALPYLEKAVKRVTNNYHSEDPSEQSAPELAQFFLAEAYHNAGRFNEADAYFDRFKTQLGNRNPELLKEVNHKQEMTFNAIALLKSPTNLIITNLGDSINSPYPDYGPVFSADESTLIFTSRRPEGTGGEKDADGRYMEDIYQSFRKPDMSWSKAVSIGPNINSAGNEATMSVSADGQTLFIYKDENEGDIYSSKLNGKDWGFPEPLGGDINSKYWETHAALSADGETLYFVSNRPGGFGGRDIYRSVKLPNGKWSKALNLGPTVNTEYDEDCPFIHPDGVTLFFSSEGHNSMGGFDVFYTTKEGEGNQWSVPKNMGSPINTTDDDVFYVPTPDGKRAYYSSERAGGSGGQDIYMVTLANAITEPVAVLRGFITVDGSNSKLPTDIRIIATDVETGEVLPDAKPNPGTGKYILILKPGQNGKTYAIHYEASGFQPIVLNVSLPPSSAYQVVEKEVDLHMINFESKTLGTIAVSGTVRQADGKSIASAKILVKDNNSGQLLNTYFSSADSGFYYFVLDRGQNYNISYQADGYLFQSENVDVPKQPAYSVVQKNIVLEPVKAGAKIVLHNIFFDNGKSTLPKASKTELETLFNLLKENPDLVVEVSGHTDNKGNDELNRKLSEARAKAVCDYLVAKGGHKNQLQSKGYGKTLPIASNSLPNGKPDPVGMQLNRRVEIKILNSK